MKRMVVCLTALMACVLAASSVVVAEDEVEIKQVTAIDWNKLAEFLPTAMDGYTADDVDGATLNMANPTNPDEKISHSHASRSFTREDDVEINVTILDAGLAQMMLQPYLMQMQMEIDGPDGSMKSIELAGYKGALITEKTNNEIETTAVFAVIADRLGIVVEGEGVTDADVVKTIITGMDLDGLAKMVGASK